MGSEGEVRSEGRRKGEVREGGENPTVVTWISPLGNYVKGKESFVQTIGEIVEIHSTFKVSAFGW